MGKKKSFVSSVRQFCFNIGDLFIFVGKFFKLLFKPPFEISEVLRQIYILGLKSLFLVSVSSFIIGFVMTVHMIPSMRKYGVESMVPNMTAISLFREIGPVVTALVCAGKIGSAIGAEIGSMKVTEQIDAMSITGIDPYNYLVVTRVIATSVCLPLLSIYSGAIGLLGGFAAEALEEKMGLRLFFTTALDYLFLHDIIPSIIKSVLFGFTIGIVGCYYGFRTVKGATGVGRSAHSTVVTTSLFVFFIDLLVVEIAHMFY